MRTTNYLTLSALVLGSAIAGCSGSSSTGPTGAGGIAAGNGGSPNVGGSTAAVGGTHTGGASVGGATVGGAGVGGAGVGGANVGGAGVGGAGVGGANVGGTAGTATGGTKATGGTVSTAGGSTSTATGGTVATATGGTVSTAGGSTSATGGNANTGGSIATTTGGVSATGGANGTCTHGANVLSDFETGKGALYPVPTSATNGFWYVYKDATNCTSAAQVPAAATDAAVLATALPTTDTRYSTCNKYAMHTSITGCPTYSGFGAALAPTLGTTINKPIDLSGFDGVSFWIKAGAGTQGPLYLEFPSSECVPAAGGGIALSPAIDQYNCHGKLLAAGTIPTTWTQMFVPFGTTGPRWFPSPGTSSTGLSCAAGSLCEVPPLLSQHVLSIQFSLEDPYNTTPIAYSNYDVWIDDVALYKFTDAPANSGIAAPSSWSASGANPFPQNKAFAGCTKPAGADGKFIQDAYVAWKAKYVTASGSNFRVVSPEINNGATVSEGIGYGMIIAAYMGDRALFDGLWGYWKANPSAQSLLMTWEIPGGSGSATDADEDAAFALIEAGKQWGGTYNADAISILGQIAANDIDASGYLKPGNSFGGQNETNPSYFAPAFYKIFATVDTANAAKWNALVTNVYTQLNNIAPAGSNGLVPAWCTANCATRGDGGKYLDDTMYQYDSHRTPWRIGLDQCWNSEARAKTYLDKVVGFFAGATATAGLSSLGDIYTSAGAKNTDSAPNSMSLTGCAGVGAMGSSATGAASFRDRAWQFLLEGQYTANPTFKTGTSAIKPGYTYYNATVGLLTLMTMSGNLYPM